MLAGPDGRSYRALPEWAHLPPGWSYADVAGVAVDGRDRVYALNRGQSPLGPEHPIVVFEPDGTFVRAFGDGLFTFAHGITVADDGTVYVADAGDHTVRAFDSAGALTMTLGEVHRPSATDYRDGDYRTIRRGAGPFNRPTRVAIGPDGDLFVSDGYGNARVHRFAPDGTLRASWGVPGDGPGQFNLVHSIWAHTDGRLYVCDRENSRVQIFEPDGTFVGAWTDVVRPQDLCIDRDGVAYVTELGERAGLTSFMPRPLGQDRLARISLLDLDGRVLARWGTEDPCAPGSFFSPHGIAVDSRGDVYVGEVVYSAGGKDGLVPLSCHALQKLVKQR